MKRILVVANETVAGKPLIDAIRGRAEGEEVHAHVISPQNMPRSGWVQYADEGRWAAENRLKPETITAAWARLHRHEA